MHKLNINYIIYDFRPIETLQQIICIVWLMSLLWLAPYIPVLFGYSRSLLYLGVRPHCCVRVLIFPVILGTPPSCCIWVPHVLGVYGYPTSLLCLGTPPPCCIWAPHLLVVSGYPTFLLNLGTPPPCCIWVPHLPVVFGYLTSLLC